MKPQAPSFHEAKNRRQKVRAAGMNPNYWYPVAQEKHLTPGKMIEATFWGRSFAVFCSSNNQMHAIENRCAHRQLKLTGGEVRGCHVVCPYHGWAFDGEGKLVDIPHELFGKEMPAIQLPHYKVRKRYGLIWLFPGDPERAETVAMPEIPELEGANRWACVPLEVTMNAHHSMILDNVSDFTHAYLHRRFQPFKDPRLTGIEAEDDRVFVDYDTQVGQGKIYGLFVDRQSANTNHMRLCYEYPHQWSNTDDWIKHWCFVLPIDERTTKTFFLFYYKALKFPFTRMHIPQKVMIPFLHIANELVMKPLLNEDKVAVEAEQLGYERHFSAPIAELNPAVKEFQALTIRKWEEYLNEQAQEPVARRLPTIPNCPN